MNGEEGWYVGEKVIFALNKRNYVLNEAASKD